MSHSKSRASPETDSSLTQCSNANRLSSFDDLAIHRRGVIMTGSPDDIQGYHAHIYYDNDTAPIVVRLRETLAKNFLVDIDTLIGGEVGPHPMQQMPVMFRKEAFQHVVPWLMLNRQGLNILVHPLTNDEYDDHTGNALWLGEPVKLKLDTLRHAGYPVELLPTTG
jgi:aromatic ring-cleaving dioxygenase